MKAYSWILIHLQTSKKILQWFVDFAMNRYKILRFSITLILFSFETLLLELKTVSKQKKRLVLVHHLSCLSLETYKQFIALTRRRRILRR